MVGRGAKAATMWQDRGGRQARLSFLGNIAWVELFFWGVQQRGNEVAGHAEEGAADAIR